MKKLIAFYSRADENYFGGQYRTIDVGNTERVARMIQEMTGADTFKIEQIKPYAADYETCIEQAKDDLRTKARPELRSAPETLEEYDEVYLGYPIYWGAMPMAVYTFLEKYDWSGKTIHPFCTHEGSGLAGTARQIEKTCPGAQVDTGLAVHGSAVDSAHAAVEQWISRK